MPTIKYDPIFRNSHRCGSLSELREPDEITAILGVKPTIYESSDPDSDGKVTLQWSFTVDGEPCAIWDYKGVRWSTWGEDATMSALFSDYIAGGEQRQSVLSRIEREPPPRDFSNNRRARKPQNFDNSGLALFSDQRFQKELF